jgi:hypothetical protein
MTTRTEPNPYSILGLAPTASQAEIQTAYRALVAKYHPDRHQGNPLEELAGAKMVEINRAYEILSDPARRTAYDGERPASAGLPFAAAPNGLSRQHIRWLQILGLLFLLPILIRFGAQLVRLLVRAGLEFVPLLRGTPVAAALVLAAISILVFALLRQRRQRRSKQRQSVNR